PTDGLDSVKNLYIGIGAVILLIAICFSFVRIPTLVDPHNSSEELHLDAVNIDVAPDKKLFQHRHFVWAVMAQYFNAAAQGGTWAFFINYGHEVMGFSDEKAGSYLVVFMGTMLLGRFIGTFLMRYIAANKLLAIFALANVVMCVIVAQGWGWISFAALLAIKYIFSIIFPTFFILWFKNLGGHIQQAWPFISMGVVGAAVFSFLIVFVADTNIATSYYL